jgi:signal transduction histidine kinase
MSLRRKIVLLGAAALALPLIELLLSGLGLALRYRVAIGLLGVATVALVSLRELRRASNDLSVIRRALNDTARGEFESPIHLSRRDEAEALARDVREMRGRLVESLRIESLNILGSILVHDMKNLSFRLRCLSQNLAANYGDPAFGQSLVRTLNDTTEKMDGMVRRFRERKELVVVKIRLDLNEVVRSALGNLRRDASGIHISEQYAKLPLVWADALLLENAVFNLVENARDAMPRGGHLAVRTRLIEQGANGPRLVAIEIADTGTGMSEEFIRRDLFAPFVTTKPRGLGLGLYTCQQIMQMHDGEVKVRSQLGRGTVFSIYLPITD